MAEKLVPITRLGKFFGAEDYSLDIGMGEEWLIGDMNFTIVLYRVDRRKTKTDDVYGEVLEDGIQFQAPVELKGLVKVMAPTSKFIGIFERWNKMNQVICSSVFTKKLSMIWELRFSKGIILGIMSLKIEYDIML
jgi:hypothetical protein